MEFHEYLKQVYKAKCQIISKLNEALKMINVIDAAIPKDPKSIMDVVEEEHLDNIAEPKKSVLNCTYCGGKHFGVNPDPDPHSPLVHPCERCNKKGEQIKHLSKQQIIEWLNQDAILYNGTYYFRRNRSYKEEAAYTKFSRIGQTLHTFSRFTDINSSYMLVKQEYKDNKLTETQTIKELALNHVLYTENGDLVYLAEKEVVSSKEDSNIYEYNVDLKNCYEKVPNFILPEQYNES